MKTKATKTPRNWRNLKRHPLSAEYPDLPQAGIDRMCASLREHGNIGNRRITLFEGMVLDGWQFLQACIQENIEPKFQELVRGDPETFVEILNDTRRHEDTETMRLRAEKRRERVVAARLQGQSTRAIAQAEGVSEKTIRSDLTTATAEGTQLPTTVTGLDGKVRPAGQPKLIPEIAAMGLSPKFTPALEDLPRGKQLDFVRIVQGGMSPRAALKAVQNQREPGDDSAPRRTIPSTSGHASALEAFNVEKFEALVGLVNQLEKGIDELVRLPGGEQLLPCTQAVAGDDEKTVLRSKHFDALKRELANTRPHSICPWCANQGEQELYEV